MSVPFSSTNLRVPRGFGLILEGLAREVLRDQPGDIPSYAARYFNVLLKKREGNIHIKEPATVVTPSE
uniref:RIIa domain-containing protein n=1 Tax=Myripristis murdjan TaxID=586833 RepID=A0A667XUT7_9TELE